MLRFPTYPKTVVTIGKCGSKKKYFSCFSIWNGWDRYFVAPPAGMTRLYIFHVHEIEKVIIYQANNGALQQKC